MALRICMLALALTVAGLSGCRSRSNYQPAPCPPAVVATTPVVQKAPCPPPAPIVVPPPPGVIGQP